MAGVTGRHVFAVRGVVPLTTGSPPAGPVPHHAMSLLVTSGKHLMILSPASRSARVLASGFTHPVGVALDATSRTAYVADLDHGAGTYSIVAVPVRKNPRTAVVHTGSGAPGQLALAAATLAFVDTLSRRLVTVNLDNGTETVLGTAPGEVGSVSYSDDGTRIRLVESATGRRLSISPGEADFTEERRSPRIGSHGQGLGQHGRPDPPARR